jgi:hypothetical protein
VTAGGVGVRPPRAATWRSSPTAIWRLLYLELRRNPWPWVVPLIVALFVFDPYRTAMGYPPVWSVRASVIPNKMLPDFVAFVAGVAAWIGGRDARRQTADIVVVTPRPGWARRGATLAATICWVLAVYLVFVAVLYVVFAQQATWGGPPWWPVAVAAAALAAICAVAFTVGELFPGRFTAPLAALGAVFVSLVTFQEAIGETGGYALLSPSATVPGIDTGVFYHTMPDLPIAQVMFLAGVAVAAVGVLGLAPGVDSGPRLRRAAAVVTLAGLAASGTAVGLAGTARPTPRGVVIPALHDAASDKPIPYTAVCGHAVVPVCVHPAMRAGLASLTAAVAPVLREVAGLPGAPGRVTQIPSGGDLMESRAVLHGSPPDLGLPLTELPGSFGVGTGEFNQDVRTLLVTAFVTGTGGPSAAGSPAQQAVEWALLARTGLPLTPPRAPQVPPGPGSPPGSTAAAQRQIYVAAHRFAAVPAAAGHTWLAHHLAALRAGRITLAQLP